MTGDGAFARYRADGLPASARAAIESYAPAACAVAHAILDDAEGAEAVVAEVLAEGLAKAEIPAGTPVAEGVWVVATTRAHALALARTNRRTRFGRRSRASEAATPAREAWAGSQIDASRAQAAFEALPTPARTALGLAYGAGLAPSEIGRRIGFGADEVRDLLRDGLLEIEGRLESGAAQ